MLEIWCLLFGIQREQTVLEHKGPRHEDQRGFTLVEMLVVIAIVGIIAGGIATTISQTLNISTRSSNHMVAVRQVQQAGKEVRKDALQSQNITLGAYDGFPLNLSWTDFNDVAHNITYTLEDGDLVRYALTGGNSTSVVIARYIDSSETSCQKSGRKLTFEVTARVGGGPYQGYETRTYEIEPRPTG